MNFNDEGGDDLVKLNIKALRDVVKAQGDAIKNLTKLLAAKMDRSDLAAALHEKANVSELTAAIEQLSSEVDNKADARDTSAVLQQMAKTKDVATALATKANVAEVQKCLDGKADTSGTQRLLAQLEKRVDELETRIGSALSAALSTASSSTPSEKKRAEVKALVDEQAEGLRSSMKRELVAEFARSRQQTAGALEAAARMEDVEELVADAVTAIRIELRRDVMREFDSYVRAYLPKSLEEYIESRGQQPTAVRGAAELESRRPWRP